MTQATGPDIAPATPNDVPLILQLIKELAEYEKLSHEVVATEALLHRALFGDGPRVQAVIASSAGQAAGFALFFHNFSTFLARPGIYLEDLFVRPAFRGAGIGKALLVHLARLACETGCGRLEWAVLDWNKPAIDFYASLGAKPVRQWVLNRLTGAALRDLART
jgi:GNAT superfamily N-acetyltransferase